VEGKKHSLTTDYIMKILGLDICADTVVGNEMLRGISGGQRKRVTSGEFFPPDLVKTYLQIICLICSIGDHDMLKCKMRKGWFRDDSFILDLLPQVRWLLERRRHCSWMKSQQVWIVQQHIRLSSVLATLCICQRELC